MRRPRTARRGIRTLFLVLTLLLTFQSAFSADYYALSVRALVTVAKPNVILQPGNYANSTIYVNSTSALVTTPTLNYPTGYNIVTGTYSSGTVPGSVNAVDSDRFVTSSTGGGGSSGNTQITPTGSSTASLSASQQRVFQNTRGQKAYYSFYRDTVSATDKCWYAYSTSGTSWTVDQDTTLSAGYVSCSVIFREDAANSRSIVYLTASQIQTTVGTGRNIVFMIGTIADSAVSITWGTIQTVSATLTSENQAYPVIAGAADGYLHIAFSYVKDAGGSLSDRQNVAICSSQTANPTSNPTWTCNDPTATEPFQESEANIATPTAMPHLIPSLSGNDILLIKGTCGGTETLPCSQGADEVERAKLLNWDGATQTFGTATSFTFPAADPPADERSATVNATSGRIHYVYQDRGTSSNLVSRYLDSPYNTWSATTTVFAGDTDGNHATITHSGSVKKLFSFYIKSSDGDLYSKNATDAQSWNTEQTEYTNSTTAAKWVSSMLSVNSTALSVVPLIWVQQAGTAELWFRRHSLSSGTGTASTEFIFTVSSTTPLQLNFTIVQQYSSGSVSVTIQVYNYTGSAYPTTGQGYQAYTSSPTADTDETQTLTITSNPQFYTQSGQVKVKVTGQVSATFSQRANLVRLYYYQTTYDYVLKIVNQQASSYNIRLNAQGLSPSNIGRLSNFTAWFHDGSSSLQLQILSGSFSTQTGTMYSLGASATAYIAVTVTASSSGVSTIDCVLQTYHLGGNSHTDYRLTFKIT